ncbi:MAG: DUF177 domain-containing protein [Acutalibacteraceae bacterium]|nr:DUF177 domain-containing protein [Acutalibacteraceae bacterium]
MILDLKSIFVNEGSSLHRNHSLSMADIKTDGYSPFVSPVEVDIQAENRAGLVKLSLATSFNYQKPCDRCGADVTKCISYQFEHYLVTSLSGDQNDDYIETPDHTIDVDELVVTDILLELPSKHLCSDDCKGLCPKCGANLNEVDCGCDTSITDPRLEVLKQLLEQED